MYFLFELGVCSSESLLTTMTEKEVEDVNRCIRIVLFSMMMSVMWFMIREVIQSYAPLSNS